MRQRTLSARCPVIWAASVFAKQAILFFLARHRAFLQSRRYRSFLRFAPRKWRGDAAYSEAQAFTVEHYASRKQEHFVLKGHHS